ncbi:MAG: L-glutamate gamma-semialdehyde dehydrogenase, partial [Balneolaceae bacterium]
MSNAYFKIQEPKNEPYFSYAPGTPQRESLKKRLKELKSEVIEIPAIINGKEVRSSDVLDVTMPHNHQHKLARLHLCGKKEVDMAIEASLAAQKKWSVMPWEERVAIFQKAADLVTGPWRDTMNASTMLGQSKTPQQAEIEAAGELADFLRFGAWYLAKIMSDQPHSPDGIWNRVEYRPLEGFVFALSPFNFTAIAGNLPSAPAMCGNVVLWKPSTESVYSNYFFMKILKEAGLPDGVINFVPGRGANIGDPVFDSPHFSGLHFTGSEPTFNLIWKTIADNIGKYKTYPRVVGETGGKDFIFAHNSADIDALVVATLRAAFEYQGQKCSAASRMYVPASIWGTFKEKFLEEVSQIKMGDVEDFSNFMGAVISKKAYDKITEYIDYAKKSSDADIIAGGEYDDSVGYFIQPTVILTKDPKFRTMEEEIFGPVLTIYVYKDEEFEQTLDLCDNTSPFALTGAIFAKDRYILKKMSDRLRQSAGNFYINEKPTGAVVNQQPFGGSRKSGTNDKAGSVINMLKWLSARSIKEAR